MYVTTMNRGPPPTGPSIRDLTTFVSPGLLNASLQRRLGASSAYEYRAALSKPAGTRKHRS